MTKKDLVKHNAHNLLIQLPVSRFVDAGINIPKQLILAGKTLIGLWMFHLDNVNIHFIVRDSI